MYTKGKWQVEKFTTGKNEITKVISREGGNHICTLDHTCTNIGGSGWDKDDLEANARLIAAAPDLYEALKLGISLHETDKNVGSGSNYASKIVDWSKYWAEMAELIAKAEGK